MPEIQKWFHRVTTVDAIYYAEQILLENGDDAIPGGEDFGSEGGEIVSIFQIGAKIFVAWKIPMPN